MIRFPAAVALLASPVTAEVFDSSAADFTFAKTVTIDASADTVWNGTHAPTQGHSGGFPSGLMCEASGKGFPVGQGRGVKAVSHG